MKPNTAADFWARLDRSGECWLWTGARSPFGYGRFRYRGQYIAAHRFAWMETNGPIENGLQVCHKCDVPHCCNPSHLFLGTAAENQRDKVAKNRQARGASHGSATKPERMARGDRHWTRLPEYSDRLARGEKQHSAKLTARDVFAIRERRKAGATLKALADDFGVTIQSVWAIDKRKTWTHV